MRFPAGWHFEGDGFDYTFKYTGDHTRKRGRPERGLRLVKAIYGLKQSGALWEETLRSFLLSINAVQCVVDPCLWRYSKGGNTLLFVVYVDDIVIACSNQEFRDAFVNTLQERFTLRDNGPRMLLVKLHTSSSDYLIGFRKLGYASPLQTCERPQQTYRTQTSPYKRPTAPETLPKVAESQMQSARESCHTRD